MRLPAPLPAPLLETSGRATLTMTVFVNVDLDQVDGTAADAAFEFEEYLLAAALPEGFKVGETMLQLAVHAPQ